MDSYELFLEKIDKDLNLNTKDLKTTQGMVLGCAMDIFATRQSYMTFNLEKVVTRLRKHGYCDLTISLAIRKLSNYEILTSSVDGEKFPMFSLYKNSEGRGLVLSRLTGINDQYVSFKKMRNGEVKRISDRAGCY